MEYLDIYTENGDYIGTEDRNIVHRDALWHKTVHCWLYDATGNIYFQIRKKENKLYTTASGHVMAGESLKQGFGREVFEEIGVNVNYEKANLVEINKFIMDKTKDDGSVFRDRAFSNVYVCEFKGKDSDFQIDLNELNGLAKVNAQEVIDLFKGNLEKVTGRLIQENNIVNNTEFKLEDFLLNKGETLIGKYGNILKKVIEINS